MRTSAIGFLVLCQVTLLGWTGLKGQSRSYHVELSESSIKSDSGNKVSNVVVVNDSDKPIEAFHLTKRCETVSGGNRVEGGARHDTLFGPGTQEGFYGPDGKMKMQSSVVQPRGRFVSGTTIFSGPETQECDAQVDAAIFADGSYEGDEAQIRGLEARRDGIEVTIGYWANRLDPEDASERNLNSVLTEAKLRAANEGVQAQHHISWNPDYPDASAAWNYWTGRDEADLFLVTNLPAYINDDASAARYKSVANDVRRWRENIEGNLAKKKLDAIFPLPLELAGDPK